MFARAQAPLAATKCITPPSENFIAQRMLWLEAYFSELFSHTHRVLLMSPAKILPRSCQTEVFVNDKTVLGMINFALSQISMKSNERQHFIQCSIHGILSFDFDFIFGNFATTKISLELLGWLLFAISF